MHLNILAVFKCVAVQPDLRKKGYAAICIAGFFSKKFAFPLHLLSLFR